MGKLRPAGQIRAAGPFIWPAGTYTNLNSHHKLSVFFFLSWMAVIFKKKQASTVQSWNKKQEKRGENVLF